MRVVALDLEMNQPSQKIIQIAACCFQPESGELFETFNQYVNPNEPISEEIKNLTRITNERLVGKPDIVTAAVSFCDFKSRLEINPIAIVWGAGRSNDLYKIFDESGVKNPFSDRIIDVKATFQMLANSSAASMRKRTGLDSACGHLGIGWDDQFGLPHDALADAFNTMRVYMFLSKCLKGGVSIKLG
jgi:DNA polymerase III epsilon subunit-like protein